MGKIVSVEGCMGAGKTTLVNFLSDELGVEKILEQAYQNPFIDEFYSGANVKLETELTFLLQHYSLSSFDYTTFTNINPSVYFCRYIRNERAQFRRF